MFTIENQLLKVRIDPKGAELQSIYHKGNGLEYMWGGDPAYWGKFSPVLFPIVGTLKKDSYFYDGRAFSLGRHGFARDMVFVPVQEEREQLRLSLRSDAGTREKFPWDFELEISYRLLPEGLRTTWTVRNLSAGEMFFSVGGHPAFKVPLVQGTSYDDYFLEFDKKEALSRWPISKEGLIEKTPVPVPGNGQQIPLTKELFAADALVFKGLSSGSVSLRSNKTPHGLDFDLGGCPFLGIWAAKNADFVCIEPWWGIADSVDSDQQLIHKEGINRLASGDVFERSWAVNLF